MRNPEAVAWVIASEGYITFRKNHNSYQPRIGVANTEKDFIDKFVAMVGNIGHIYSYGHKNPKHSIKWFWELYSRGDCLEFLTTIRDYLPIKQEQADIVINHCLRYLSRFGTTERLLSDIKDLDDLLDCSRMVELNQRGRK